MKLLLGLLLIAPPAFALTVRPKARAHELRANARQRANLLAEIIALRPRYGPIAGPTEIVHGSTDTTVALAIDRAAARAGLR